MLELEEQVAQYGAYLDGLDAPGPEASTVRNHTTSDAGLSVRTSGPRTRARVLVAVCLVVIVAASIAGAFALSRHDGRSVRIAAPASEPPEVGFEQLPRSATNLFVYFVVDATDMQTGQVRAVLDSSPDVVHYAFLDHEAAKIEFAQLYACHPDLVQSLGPQDLPESFRVSTVNADAATRLQVTLGNAPGGALVTTEASMYPIPARSDQTASTPFPAPCKGSGAATLPSYCGAGVSNRSGTLVGCLALANADLTPPERDAAAAGWTYGEPVYDLDGHDEVVGYIGTLPTDAIGIGFVPIALAPRRDELLSCNLDLVNPAATLTDQCRQLLIEQGVSESMIDDQR